MANQEQLEILKSGVKNWNKWRIDNINTSIELERTNLAGANLAGADLSKANLSRANLLWFDGQGVFLAYANLVEANLAGANLQKANLAEAKLERANLQRAILSGANLSRVFLSGANLTGANLAGANLQEANLTGANLAGANLQEANLTGANLAGANLTGANLAGANLESAYLIVANLAGANLKEAKLEMANLERANLKEANLKEANLESANLESANLEGAKLSGANLTGANLSGANLQEANLSGANLESAYLIVANLAGANLKSAKLEMANFERANLERANLKEANLKEANLESANLEGAKLSGANLSGANLSGVKLEGHYLSMLKLPGLNLPEADLSSEWHYHRRYDSIRIDRQMDYSIGGTEINLDKEQYSTTTEKQKIILDQVEFSVYSPKTITSGCNFIIDVWASFQHQSSEVLKEAKTLGREKRTGVKKGISVSLGANLEVSVNIDCLEIDDPYDTLEWNGTPINASFGVHVPEETKVGSYNGKAIISCNSFVIAKVIFLVYIGEEEKMDYENINQTTFYPKSAFASYSSEDRIAVLSRIDGMKKIAPNIDVFCDVLTLRSGENWLERIKEEVASKDIFYLFWSHYAAKSEWVEKEWRLALNERGIDYIDPVPLEDVDLAPPPSELKEKHFTSNLSSLIQILEWKKHWKEDKLND